MLFSLGVWYSAHILAVFCLVLALFLVFSSARWRGLGIGEALVVAFLSRQVTILTLPFFMILLAEYERPKPKITVARRCAGNRRAMVDACATDCGCRSLLSVV